MQSQGPTATVLVTVIRHKTVTQFFYPKKKKKNQKASFLLFYFIFFAKLLQRCLIFSFCFPQKLYMNHIQQWLSGTTVIAAFKKKILIAADNVTKFKIFFFKLVAVYGLPLFFKKKILEQCRLYISTTKALYHFLFQKFFLCGGFVSAAML